MCPLGWRSVALAGLAAHLPEVRATAELELQHQRTVGHFVHVFAFWRQEKKRDRICDLVWTPFRTCVNRWNKSQLPLLLEPAWRSNGGVSALRLVRLWVYSLVQSYQRLLLGGWITQWFLGAAYCSPKG